MKKKPFVYLSVILAALLAVAAYYFMLPIVSPTMTWQRFSEMVEAALKKEDNPVIVLGKRVLSRHKEDMDRPLHCGPEQSVTIVGTGREDGDFERMYLGSGDIRLRNVRVGASGDGIIHMYMAGPASSTLLLDEHCEVQGAWSAIRVEVKHIMDGARLRIENAGKVHGATGIFVSTNTPRSHEAEIVNSGIIEAGDQGIVFMNRGGDGSSRVRIANTGTISAGDSSAVFARVRTYNGDVSIDVENAGDIRSAQLLGIFARVLAGNGRATVTVRNGERGTIESATQGINVSGSNNSRIRVENTGRIQSRQEPIFADFSWQVPVMEMPQGWDTNDETMRAEAKRFAISKIRETGMAVLPAGTQIKVRVGITGNGEDESKSELYHAFFTFLAGMDMNVPVGEN